MAEEQFYTILTNVGKAKIANATLLNSDLTLKTLKVGDGNGTYYNPTEDQEDLKNTVHECAIGAIYIDKKNPNWIISETIIPGSVGGFTIREVGLFDAEGDMIAVGKYPETYKPVVANGASKDLNVRTIFEVSNAENVTLNLDPSVIIATKEDINNLQEQIDENTAQLKDLANERGYARVKRFEVETDLNALTESGVYASAKFLNGNDNEKTWKIVEVFNMSIDNQIYCIQRIMGIADGGDRTFERRCNNGIWSEWKQLATTKSITLTLLNGATAFGQSEGNGYFPTCIQTGNTVTIDGTVNVANVSDDTAILNNLPTPKQGHRWYTSYSINNVKIDLYLSYEGTLRVRSANGMSSNDGLPINITYEVN